MVSWSHGTQNVPRTKPLWKMANFLREHSQGTYCDISVTTYQNMQGKGDVTWIQWPWKYLWRFKFLCGFQVVLGFWYPPAYAILFALKNIQYAVTVLWVTVIPRNGVVKHYRSSHLVTFRKNTRSTTVRNSWKCWKNKNLYEWKYIFIQ